jgi:hypothetical protein
MSFFGTVPSAGQDDHAARRHQHAKAVEHLGRIWQRLKIDDRHRRLGTRSKVRPHHRPRVGRDDLEAVFDELRAQWRARQPGGAEQDDVGRPLFVHSILSLAHPKHFFIDVARRRLV